MPFKLKDPFHTPKYIRKKNLNSSYDFKILHTIIMVSIHNALVVEIKKKKRERKDEQGILYSIL